jgi:acyl-CoA thioesterase FadM
VATATMTVVAVTARTFTKRSLPDEVRDGLARFVVTTVSAPSAR